MLRGVTSSAQIQANKPKTEGKGYILAIGIDNYQHCPKLQNAVRDVQNITRVLTHRYQFDSTNLTLLTNEQATHSTILEKLRRLQECVTSSDTVIIYFFGHGTYEDAINEGYWIPVEGDVARPHTLISNSTIVKRVQAIQSRHTLLIVDSCFAGSFFFTTRIAGIRERLAEVPSRWAFTSGRNKVVADDSPFAQGLTGYLNYNTQPQLWLTELSPKIIEQVGANSEQIPQCEPL